MESGSRIVTLSCVGASNHSQGHAYLPKLSVLPAHQRAWIPLSVSAAAHLLLLALVAELTRQPNAVEAAQQDRRAVEARHVDMIYVPPPKAPLRSPSLPPPPPTPPPPPVRHTAPEPEPNAPPEATRSAGSESAEQGAPPEGKELARAPLAEPAKPAENEATLESEARRIFGRPRPSTQSGAGPRATRPMEAWVANRPERCTPHPVPPADSAGPAELGTVIGRIFRQDNGRPLAGAHLQMIGSPYVTFTDGSGEYRFQFDLALVDNCRIQYVRVSAPGYESRLLVLVVGPNAQSEEVRLRRR